jgi:hypothetical protein
MYCTVLYDILLVIYNKAGCCASGRIKAVRWRSQFTVVATEACPDTGATRRYKLCYDSGSRGPAGGSETVARFTLS